MTQKEILEKLNNIVVNPDMQQHIDKILDIDVKINTLVRKKVSSLIVLENFIKTNKL
jgi:hypothetical protein